MFTSGLLHSAAAWDAHSSLPSRLRRAGFTTALLDLPGYGRAPAGWPANASIDDLVSELRTTIGKLHVPPILIAPDLTACLFQKYLESHALAGFIVLSPLPPDPRQFLRRVCKLPDDAVITPKHVASWLRRAASSEEGAAQLWLGGSPNETEVQALFASVEELAGSPAEDDDSSSGGVASTRLCGFEAAASWLANLAAEPVNLEPQPVPMAAIYGAADACLQQTEREATPLFHDMRSEATEPAGDSSWLGRTVDATAATFADDVAAFESGAAPVVQIAGAGHDLLRGDAHAVKALEQLIAAWIEKRY